MLKNHYLLFSQYFIWVTKNTTPTQGGNLSPTLCRRGVCADLWLVKCDFELEVPDAVVGCCAGEVILFQLVLHDEMRQKFMARTFRIERFPKEGVKRWVLRGRPLERKPVRGRDLPSHLHVEHHT